MLPKPSSTKWICFCAACASFLHTAAKGARVLLLLPLAGLLVLAITAPVQAELTPFVHYADPAGDEIRIDLVDIAFCRDEQDLWMALKFAGPIDAVAMFPEADRSLSVFFDTDQSVFTGCNWTFMSSLGADYTVAIGRIAGSTQFSLDAFKTPSKTDSATWTRIPAEGQVNAPEGLILVRIPLASMGDPSVFNFGAEAIGVNTEKVPDSGFFTYWVPAAPTTSTTTTTTAPASGTVVLYSPVTGAVLSDKVAVSVGASAGVPVKKLQLYLDGQLKLTVMESFLVGPGGWSSYDSSTDGDLLIQAMVNPFTIEFVAGAWANGAHSLMARAYSTIGSGAHDSTGVIGTASVSFTIDHASTSSTTTTTSTSTTTTTVQSTTTTTLPSQQFSDVPAYHPYAEQIADVASRGIVLGSSPGIFQPDAPVTRQQFAKMVVKTLGLPVTGSEVCPFNDVLRQIGDDPLYPSKYVAVCVAQGITQGKSSIRFAPYENMSRAQLFTMIARATNLSEPPAYFSPPFGNFSSVHYPWARKASYAGLLDDLLGIDAGGYAFWGNATRGEVCVLLYNILHR
jgi:hypothetical protein